MDSILWVQEDRWWNWHHWLPKSHHSFSLAGKAQILFGCDTPLSVMEVSPNSSQLVKIIPLSLLKGHLTNSWSMRHGRVCWTLLGKASSLLRDTQGRDASSPLDVAASAWDVWNGYSHLTMSGELSEDRAATLKTTEQEGSGGSMHQSSSGDGGHDVIIEQPGATWRRSKGTNSQQVSGETPLCGQYLTYKS